MDEGEIGFRALELVDRGCAIAAQARSLYHSDCWPASEDHGLPRDDEEFAVFRSDEAVPCTKIRHDGCVREYN